MADTKDPVLMKAERSDHSSLARNGCWYQLPGSESDNQSVKSRSLPKARQKTAGLRLQLEHEKPRRAARHGPKAELTAQPDQQVETSARAALTCEELRADNVHYSTRETEMKTFVDVILFQICTTRSLDSQCCQSHVFWLLCAIIVA